jgi:hypothetical protein
MNETAPLTLIWLAIVEGILIIHEQFSNDVSDIRIGIYIDYVQ